MQGEYVWAESDPLWILSFSLLIARVAPINVLWIKVFSIRSLLLDYCHLLWIFNRTDFRKSLFILYIDIWFVKYPLDELFVRMLTVTCDQNEITIHGIKLERSTKWDFSCYFVPFRCNYFVYITCLKNYNDDIFSKC